MNAKKKPVLMAVAAEPILLPINNLPSPMLTLIQSTCEQYIAGLHLAIRQGDLVTIKRLANTLRESFETIDAGSLLKLAENFSDLLDRNMNVSELEFTFRRLESVFDDFMRNRLKSP